ncbi:MAG: hypothetical protein M1816_002688 [Peltula sp. TS41687]|nr:MAG: hypothetical protein M1816_002688 [Peltula sp. TS41687]
MSDKDWYSSSEPYPDLSDFQNAEKCSKELNSHHKTERFRCEEDPRIVPRTPYTLSAKFFETLRKAGIQAKLWFDDRVAAGAGNVNNIVVQVGKATTAATEPSWSAIPGGVGGIWRPALP